MYRPPINFLTLHYAYIILMGLMALPVLYPYGNMTAIDAWFFGASASTESGLNTIDVKELKTYQQFYIYFIPILTNLGFINIIVVIVRLHWFKRHLKRLAPQILCDEQNKDVEVGRNESNLNTDTTKMSTADISSLVAITKDETTDRHDMQPNRERLGARTTTISFNVPAEAQTGNTSLYIPGPRARERANEQGQPIVTKIDGDRYDESDDGKTLTYSSSRL
ncbi:unnamed protein product, partial [Fusarium langsethiae]